MNFTSTSANAVEEQKAIIKITEPNKNPIIKGDALINGYNNARKDNTIPNAAYNYGASIAEKKGWTVGNTGHKPDTPLPNDWNPFK